MAIRRRSTMRPDWCAWNSGELRDSARKFDEPGLQSAQRFKLDKAGRCRDHAKERKWISANPEIWWIERICNQRVP